MTQRPFRSNNFKARFSYTAGETVVLGAAGKAVYVHNVRVAATQGSGTTAVTLFKDGSGNELFRVSQSTDQEYSRELSLRLDLLFPNGFSFTTDAVRSSLVSVTSAVVQ